MQLRVTDFSSIKFATMDFSQIVVIIGPQASGKSVLCKLAYFFLAVPDEAVLAISDGASYEAFIESTKGQFLQWFPLESWGNKKFEIGVTAGDYEVKISRTEYKGKLGQSFRIWFSDAFKSFYKELLTRAEKLSSASPRTTLVPHLYEMRRTSNRLLSTMMKADFIGSQLFIPAGRSFFTSVGHAIAVFERGSTLDPLTIVFGRLFRTQLDSITRRRPARPQTAITRLTVELMGGQISGSRNSEHLLTPDGRKIPLALMSSGQQELLPLLTIVPAAFLYEERKLVYIEEPEAHLFPETQSKLVETLVGLVSASNDRTSLVLTTHSPYVLSKFNNLVKAGAVAKGKLRSAVNAIIPQDAWLEQGRLTAYAIVDGVVRNITEESGLINGDYLDNVSGQIGEQFDALLDLETPTNG